MCTLTYHLQIHQYIIFSPIYKILIHKFQSWKKPFHNVHVYMSIQKSDTHLHFMHFKVMSLRLVRKCEHELNLMIIIWDLKSIFSFNLTHHQWYTFNPIFSLQSQTFEWHLYVLECVCVCVGNTGQSWMAVTEFKHTFSLMWIHLYTITKHKSFDLVQIYLKIQKAHFSIFTLTDVKLSVSLIFFRC